MASSPGHEQDVCGMVQPLQARLGLPTTVGQPSGLRQGCRDSEVGGG